MTSLNGYLESRKSDPFVIQFAREALLSPVRNLRKVSATEHAITITWDPSIHKGSGYTVSYHPTYMSDHFAVTVNVTVTSATGIFLFFFNNFFFFVVLIYLLFTSLMLKLS